MKRKVLLDMDGVIANFYHEFARFLNENYNCTLPIDTEPNDYSFKKWGHGVDYVDMDSASNEWLRSGGISRIPAFNNASDFVNKLNDEYNVHIVTARVGDWGRVLPPDVKEKVKQDTQDWLITNNMPHENLYFSHQKIDFCKEFGISVMIEDKMSTALNASKNGIHTILIDRRYNYSPVDRFKIYRAYSFDDVFNLIRRIYNEP